MPTNSSVTVVVLSAGGSGVLQAVLRAVTECVPPPNAIECVWSGSPGKTPVVPKGVRIVPIPADCFDHGATRQAALERCATEIVAFLSDDAEPVGANWLTDLV